MQGIRRRNEMTYHSDKDDRKEGIRLREWFSEENSRKQSVKKNQTTMR